MATDPTSIQLKASIERFDKVMSNLNQALMQIEGGTYKGLLEVAKFIQRDMETTPPLTPVKTGHMRSSWGTRPIWFKRQKVGIIMGYQGVDYAWKVHEYVDVKHWTRKDSGAHWFYAALQRNMWSIIQIVAVNAKPSKL